MKYLILILTLLFSFNVKAEIYSCAYAMGDRIAVDRFERVGDSRFTWTTRNMIRYGGPTYETSRYPQVSLVREDEDWIFITYTMWEPTFIYDSNAFHINKKTGLFHITQFRDSRWDDIVTKMTHDGTCEVTS